MVAVFDPRLSLLGLFRAWCRWRVDAEVKLAVEKLQRSGGGGGASSQEVARAQEEAAAARERVERLEAGECWDVWGVLEALTGTLASR